MSKEFEPKIVVDRFGHLDVQYYEDQARRMRSEAFFTGIKIAARGLRYALLTVISVTGSLFSRLDTALQQRNEALQSRNRIAREA